MENLTGISAPVRPLPCVVPCKLYFEEEFDIIFDEKTMHYTTFQKVGDLVDYCYSLIEQ